MKWSTLLVLAAVVAVYVLWTRTGLVGASDAITAIHHGAMVVDVRDAAEYQTRHIAGSINIPLDELESVIPARVPDQQRSLLVHCHSGMRSAIAVKKLRKLGYNQAHNLGSFERAREIVDKANAP